MTVLITPDKDEFVKYLLNHQNETNKNIQIKGISQPSIQENYIISKLLPIEFDCLSQYLELVFMPVGKVLYEPGKKLQYVYFPTNCIVSLYYILASGQAAETASLGNEGIYGTQLIIGDDSTPISAMVQIAGYAYRLDGNVFKQAFCKSINIQELLLEYMQTLFVQTALIAVCYRHHNIRQQLSRWLLLTLDRLPSNEMSVTHELVANVLGVRREGITEAACFLKDEGLISYRRGHLMVLDRNKLSQYACECYTATKNVLKRN